MGGEILVCSKGLWLPMWGEPDISFVVVLCLGGARPCMCGKCSKCSWLSPLDAFVFDSCLCGHHGIFIKLIIRKIFPNQMIWLSFKTKD